jgi:ArsR family transcriptional regulator
MREPEVKLCGEFLVHGDKTARALQKLPEDDLLIDLAELFKIFGDSTRVKILYLLLEEEMCVCDIAESLKMTVSAISHQLRILKGAKLIKFRKEGKSVFYSLADEHVNLILKQGMEHITE